MSPKRIKTCMCCVHVCDAYQPVPAQKADHEYSGAEPELFPPLF